MFSPLYFTVITLWLGHFFVDFMLGIWPVYKTIAELDIAKAGMIAGVSALIGEGSQLLFGALSDKGYRRWLIALGILLTSLSAGLAYTKDYVWLTLIFVSVTIGSGMFHPSAASLLGQLTEKRKALLLGIFVSGGGVGMAVSQLLFVQTYRALDGQVLYLGLPCVFLILFVFFKAFHSPHLPAQEKSTFEHVKGCFKLFKNKDMKQLYIVQLSNQTIFWATIFLLPDILYSRGYDDWICFGGGHMCTILGSSIAMLFGGYLADRFSSRNVILLFSSFGMVLCYTIIGQPNLSNTALLILLFFFGIAGSLSPIVLALGNRILPESPGKVSAFLMGLVWCIAEVLGPGGGGWLTKLFSEDAPAKALGIISIFFLICIVFAYRLPQPERKRTAEALNAEL